MPAIISLIYLMFSLLVFTKKITISNVLSAFLLFLSLYILHHKSLLIFIYCLIIIVATVILLRVKISADEAAHEKRESVSNKIRKLKLSRFN